MISVCVFILSLLKTVCTVYALQSDSTWRCQNKWGDFKFVCFWHVFIRHLTSCVPLNNRIIYILNGLIKITIHMRQNEDNKKKGNKERNEYRIKYSYRQFLVIRRTYNNNKYDTIQRFQFPFGRNPKGKDHFMYRFNQIELS